MTQAGTVLGTFQYMSPEQLEGKEADARSDIFAFGAVLYEMATGKKAFSGASQASLISAIMREDPETDFGGGTDDAAGARSSRQDAVWRRIRKSAGSRREMCGRS